MKTIQTFEEVKTLPIPDDIKAKLLAHLIEPFGDAESTQAFWQDVGTTLYLIESSDTDSTLSTEAEVAQHFIRYVTNYPEWVLLLNGDDCPWILAVAIITMEGGGAYLLAPSTSQTKLVYELLLEATDS